MATQASLLITLLLFLSSCGIIMARPLHNTASPSFSLQILHHMLSEELPQQTLPQPLSFFGDPEFFNELDEIVVDDDIGSLDIEAFSPFMDDPEFFNDQTVDNGHE